MKLSEVTPAKYNFTYRHKPRSGNLINGLGETDYREPRHVFHGSLDDTLDWAAMNRFFTLANHWKVVWHMAMARWALRRAEGSSARKRVVVDDAQASSEAVRKKAIDLGAAEVGITEVTRSALFEGHDSPYENAIVIGIPMNREEMAHVPRDPAAVEVMRVYRRVAEVTTRLAAHIRALGYSAKAYGEPNSSDILHIPLAVSAGIGELGKHGSLICKEYGSNLRLGTVVTDLPLMHDTPVDIGVEDFCLNCRVCTSECPPNAISDNKQMVRGVEKWYVDFDKCIPYFTKTKGCAICIQVCPWSETGRGLRISEKMLARRRRKKNL